MVFMAYALQYEELTLPENFNWHRSSDLFWRFFLLTRTLCSSLLNLNFTITDSFLYKRWQACRSSGLTLCPVKKSALQMFTLSSSSLIDGGTGFIFTDSCQWYWAFVTTSLSNWTTIVFNNLLQFLTLANSDKPFLISSKNHWIDLISQRVLIIYH